MYQIKKKGIVHIRKGKHMIKINLENATQKQLKELFEMKHPFVIEDKKEPVKKK